MRAVCAPKCLEKDAHADFLCLHCYPNAVGDNTWAYFLLLLACREEVQIHRDEKRQQLDRQYDDLMLLSHSLFALEVFGGSSVFGED